MGASHGWVPVDTHSTTRADFGPEAVGSSNHKHDTSPSVKPYGRVKSCINTKNGENRQKVPVVKMTIFLCENSMLGTRWTGKRLGVEWSISR